MARISKATEIEQRRMAVLQLLSKGYSQSDVAKGLNYSKACISNDVRILKETTRKTFRHRVEHELPFQFRVAEEGLLYVKKRASLIADTTKDERIKLQALKESVLSSCL